MEREDAKRLWVDVRRSIVNRAINTGDDIDMSNLSDDDIRALCDIELLRDMDFIADMSDSYSTTKAEKKRNRLLFDAANKESDVRGL